MPPKSTDCFSDKVIAFYQSISLSLPHSLGVTVLNPYQQQEVMLLVQQFCHRFYKDGKKRIFLFGINPGRFGSGATGISFTDPVALRAFCGIENELGNRKELSSEFIYRVIEAYGGVKKFYGKFFITAICPLGFMKGTKNYNYYDDKNLFDAVITFIERCWQQQLNLGADDKVAICIGSGKNKMMIEKLNAAFPIFKDIHCLEHPRFIMQYRRKSMEEYIERYVSMLRETST